MKIAHSDRILKMESTQSNIHTRRDHGAHGCPGKGLQTPMLPFPHSLWVPFRTTEELQVPILLKKPK